MKKNKDYTLTAILIPFLIAVLFNLPSCYKEPVKEVTKVHKCNFKLCPYLGDTVYIHKHTGDNEMAADDIGSDCDIIDRIHWQRPDFTYDECEEAMMND